VRVAEKACDADFIDRQRLGVDLSAAALSFLAKRIDGGDAQHVAVQLTGQVVVLQDDVQRLIQGTSSSTMVRLPWIMGSSTTFNPLIS